MNMSWNNKYDNNNEKKNETKTKYGVITDKIYDFLLIFPFFGSQTNAVDLFLKFWLVISNLVQFIRFL